LGGKKPTIKLTKAIKADDKSVGADILRTFVQLMEKNLLLFKYDLRFNPLSHDAALILY
jgi:hypothetical protein